MSKQSNVGLNFFGISDIEEASATIVANNTNVIETTLTPVLIANPQVEKNIETKNDNTNALVVLQPTIGNTELVGGEIRINDINKITTTKLSTNCLVFSAELINDFYTRIGTNIYDDKSSTDITSTQMTIEDADDPNNLKCTLTRSSLNIKRSAIVNSNLTPDEIKFSGVGVLIVSQE